MVDRLKSALADRYTIARKGPTDYQSVVPLRAPVGRGLSIHCAPTVSLVLQASPLPSAYLAEPDSLGEVPRFG